MILLTAMTMGVTAGLMRSAFSVAVIAVLIVAVFAAASLVSPGPVSFFSLLMAIAGYNIGVFGLLGAMLLQRKQRSA